MADKDVDEQFAAIMAHWHEDALGLDPFGDPQNETTQNETTQATPQGPEGSDPADRAEAPGQVEPDVGDGASRTTALSDPGAGGAEPDQVRRAPDEPTPAAPSAAAPSVNPAPPMPPRTPTTPVAPTTPMTPTAPMTPEHAAGLGWRQHVPQPEPEDHFVPPPPAPLPPAEDKHFWLMMAGLIGGPLLFLYLILFNRDGNGWWMVCGIAMTLAGFVLLVLRQPFERDEDDDGVRL